jgi:HlyD family secretion protein
VRLRMPWWIWGTLVVAVAIAVWHYTDRPAPLDYVTAPVTRGSVTSTITASGTVNPVVTVQVGTYVSGIVASVTCDFNTRVVKGQQCAKIDPRPYETVVAQDQANLAAARAQLQKDQVSLQYAQITYRRNADLKQRGIVSQDVVDQAKSAADEARAQVALDRTAVQQRQAALQASQVNLSYTNIVSPVNGTVVSRNVTPGQTVAASFQTPTLFLIATDLTRMEVDTNVSESDIGGVAKGHAASFTVEAYPDRTFAGTVTQVRQAPQTVQNVVTYDAVVSAPNPQGLLKPGMTATVHVVTASRTNVLRVPDQALRFTPGGIAATSGHETPMPVGDASGGQPATVWVLRQGQPVRVPVTIGLDDEKNAEVIRGSLQPGDRVIVAERSGTQPDRSRGAPRLRLL